MKKRFLIILGVILFGMITILFKINSDLNDLENAFNSEHSLNKADIIILEDAISPNKKYRYYKYQFDNGVLGYSKIFYSVIKNDEKVTNLKKGIIPSNYKIIGWNDKSKLIIQRDLNSKSESISESDYIFAIKDVEVVILE